MAQKFSTGLRAHVAATGSFKAALDGTVFDFYASATVPASADDAVGSATKLVRITVSGGAGITLEQVLDLLKKPAGAVWTGTNLAAGEGKFFRQVKPADDGSASTTAIRVQGELGLTNDFPGTLVSNTFVAGQETPVANYVLDLSVWK